MESLDAVIAVLNHLGVGALDKIEADLASVREELERRGLPLLVERVDACQRALRQGDLEEFRRLKESIVSRLGHVRLKNDR